MAAVIRLARPDDAADMLAIYAPVVRETAISFETEPPTEEEFRGRISGALEVGPWLACEPGGDVAGYAYAGRYAERTAYRWSMETTVYVARGWRRRGVGVALYISLLACLRLLGFHNAVAIIALPNAASVALHERLGFEPVGVHPVIGHKLGRWHDVGRWQLRLAEPGADPTPPRCPADLAGTPGWREALEAGLPLLKAG